MLPPHVTLRAGLPWPWRRTRAHACVLPATWGVRRLRVHARGTLDAETLRHELFHVAQDRAHLGGRGLGFLRPFTIAYVAHALRCGTGRAHPLEAPAYAGAPLAAAAWPFWRTLRDATPGARRLPAALGWPLTLLWTAALTLGVAAGALLLALTEPARRERHP